jgi:thiol-disulfide isomerase/thioredoxin
LLAALALVSCAPPPDFRRADGTGGNYADWNGKWVVINYWAEWCAPCRHEIPELNALYGQSEHTPVVVVGVNFDGLEGEALTQLIARMDIRFPVIVGAPRLHWDYPLPTVLPTTVVIGPDGKLAATLVGPQTLDSVRAVWSAPAATHGAAGR